MKDATYPEVWKEFQRVVNAALPDKAEAQKVFDALAILERIYVVAVDDANNARDEAGKLLTRLNEQSITNDATFNRLLLEAARHQDQRQTEEEADRRAYDALHNPFHFDHLNHIDEIMLTTEKYKGYELGAIQKLM